MEACKTFSQSSILNEVLNASARSYELYGLPSTEILISNEYLAPSLVIRSMNRIENIISEYMLDSIETEKYLEYRNNGIEVLVLVPLNTMGKAHEMLRDYADWIQPWWFENNSVKFGRPEIP